jgi:hypothetical protein
MKSPHQTIQTKTMPKSALPTAMPTSAVSTAAANPNRLRLIKCQLRARCFKSPNTAGQWVNSTPLPVLTGPGGARRLMVAPRRAAGRSRWSGT